MDCTVCIESFNKSTRKPVTCPYCATSICRTCIQTCLLQDSTAHCQNPECKKPWTDEFLYSAFTKVWLDGPYREYCAKLLMDREKARLPETQEHAAIYINAKALVGEIQPQIDAAETEIEALPITKEKKALSWKANNYTIPHKERKEAMDRYDIVHPDYLTQTKPYRKRIKQLKSEAFQIAMVHIENYGREKEQVVVHEKKWTFVGKCPKPECNGFIGMDYTCGLCKVDVCKECLEPRFSEHTCNADIVLSVQAMRNEAKPCPKCATMISKIDGCDQMWCTQCHTAFSWRTGAEETVVHNPHFYEWMRRTGQAMAPGPVGPAQQPLCEFGRVWNTFINAIKTAYPDQKADLDPYTRRILNQDNPTLKSLYAIAESSSHYDATTMGLRRQLQTEQQTDEEAKRVLRVRKLANEISDADWMTPLEKMDRTSKRRNALVHIYDMYVQTSMVLMHEFVQRVNRKDSLEEIHAHLFHQYKELTTYVNDELKKLKKQFSFNPEFIKDIVA